MYEFLGSCSPTGELPGKPWERAGKAWNQWLEVFFSEPRLHHILSHVLCIGHPHNLSEHHLVTCVAVMKSCLGWFQDIEPTVEAAAMYLLNHNALAWLPLDLPIDKSEGEPRW